MNKILCCHLPLTGPCLPIALEIYETTYANMIKKRNAEAAWLTCEENGVEGDRRSFPFYGQLFFHCKLTPKVGQKKTRGTLTSHLSLL